RLEHEDVGRDTDDPYDDDGDSGRQQTLAAEPASGLAAGRPARGPARSRAVKLVLVGVATRAEVVEIVLVIVVAVVALERIAGAGALEGAAGGSTEAAACGLLEVTAGGRPLEAAARGPVNL